MICIYEKYLRHNKNLPIYSDYKAVFRESTWRDRFDEMFSDVLNNIL